MWFDPAHTNQLVRGTTAAGCPSPTLCPELRGVFLRDQIRQFAFPVPPASPVFSLEDQDRVVQSSADSSLHFYVRIRSVGSGSLPAGTSIKLSNVRRIIPAPAPDSMYLDWRPDGLGSVAPTWASYAPEQPMGRANIYFYIDPAGVEADTDSRLQAIPGDGTRFMYAATGTRSFREDADALLITVIRSDRTTRDWSQQAAFVPVWS
jgi:hypothetical protein